MQTAPVFDILRHRIGTDGPGVTTLVCLHGCPLKCRFCINPESRDSKRLAYSISCEELFEKVKKDNLYFLSTGGGVCFGGGEPAIHSSFIKEFKNGYAKKWNISIETSLNVASFHIEELIHVIDSWVVDVKDTNSSIYSSYCGNSNENVWRNLSILAEKVSSKVTIKLPLIPYYNNESDIIKSFKLLNKLGFKNINVIKYCVNGN